MLKAVSGGYDGRGVWVCETPGQAAYVLAHGIDLIVEEHVAFERELAVLVARSPHNQAAVYPVVQTIQRDGICREVLAPAPGLDEDTAVEAERLGLAIAAGIGVTGILAVELFQTPGGLLVNELAMRPHNSGHWTIEGARTSQFEQHLRAVLDLPLGAPMLAQGSVISPLLANAYLHYSFDLWAERWRRREATGDMIIVRYADDIVVGFEHETDARRFWDAMRVRLQEFSLSLHPEKTRLIEFGRHAANKRKQRGLGKPETFNFLGMTFTSAVKSRGGKFLLKRRTTSRPHAGEDQGGCGGTSAADASVYTQQGKMAEASHHRLLQLTMQCLPIGRRWEPFEGAEITRTLAPDTTADAAKKERSKPGTRMVKMADDWLPKAADH